MSTDNLNIQNNFVFTFDKIDGVAYNTQNLQLPAITLGETIVPNKSVDYSVPGDKLTFDKLNIRFLVDEDLENYMQLYKWLMDMRNPETCERADIYSDCQLTILNNNKNVLKKFTFVDCYPILLDVLEFDYASDADAQSISATISYTYFKESA